MALRQYMIVFCLLLFVTLGRSFSMKHVMDRLNALEIKIETSEKRFETENKLRRSETEELFRMFSELVDGKILSRSEHVSPDENITPSRQLTTKSPSADKYTTTELAIEVNNLKSYIINGVAVEKQQNVKLRSELKNISKQLEADYTLFESRIKEEIRNFTNDVSDKLTLLGCEERFNNLSDFVTTTQSELRNEIRQSLISLNSDIESSIQKLSKDLHIVNQTVMKNVESRNNFCDYLETATTALPTVTKEERSFLTSLKPAVTTTALPTVTTKERSLLTSLKPAVETTTLSQIRNETRSSFTSLKPTVKASILGSCNNAPQSNGIYYMYIAKLAKPLRVYCDQETDGGGWLVIQRRKDGSVDFYRNWINYKTGFGDLENEFWFGNDNIHALTSSSLNELRIDMMDFEGNKAYAKYSNFKVHPESDLYKLEVGGYSGNASDSLRRHNGQAFSTKDRDNDIWHFSSCSEDYRGAWWYGSCSWSNLNGRYYHGDNPPHVNGIHWYYWKGYDYSLKTVEMKIR